MILFLTGFILSRGDTEEGLFKCGPDGSWGSEMPPVNKIPGNGCFVFQFLFLILFSIFLNIP